jgi:predicted acyltransferase
MPAVAILSTVDSWVVPDPLGPVNSYNRASQAFEVPGRNAVALFLLFKRVMRPSWVEDRVSANRGSDYAKLSLLRPPLDEGFF